MLSPDLLALLLHFGIANLLPFGRVLLELLCLFGPMGHLLGDSVGNFGDRRQVLAHTGLNLGARGLIIVDGLLARDLLLKSVVIEPIERVEIGRFVSFQVLVRGVLAISVIIGLDLMVILLSLETVIFVKADDGSLG